MLQLKLILKLNVWVKENKNRVLTLVLLLVEIQGFGMSITTSDLMSLDNIEFFYAAVFLKPVFFFKLFFFFIIINFYKSVHTLMYGH